MAGFDVAEIGLAEVGQPGHGREAMPGRFAGGTEMVAEVAAEWRRWQTVIVFHTHPLDRRHDATRRATGLPLAVVQTG